MPMPKRKPNFNASATMQELLAAVCDFYGDPVDDRTTEDPDHVSLHDVAEEFEITVMKARKHWHSDAPIFCQGSAERL